MAFLEAANILSDTIKGHPGLMIVWGLAGRGKSECAKKYATKMNEKAIYVHVQEDWSQTDFLAEICERINGMRPARKGYAKRVILEEFDKPPHRILIIDEADRLIMHNIEHLRDMHKLTGISIVLIGEPSIYGKLSARKRIMDLVTRVVEFGPVTEEDVILYGLKACDLRVLPDAAVEISGRIEGSWRQLLILMVDIERKCKASKLNEVTQDLVQSISDKKIAPTRGMEGK